MRNPPVRLLPFFILTENNDLATEYEYRHEGVNDRPGQYPGADPAGSVLCGIKCAYIFKHLPPQRGKEKNADGQRILYAFRRPEKEYG